tara:strand:- start:266 stop:595 length:330 start_codon:yes stop_codon:yes gene_type:complete
MKDKLDVMNSIKILISPYDKGFTCGMIVGENLKITSEQYELITTIGRGMIKFASDNPGEAFKLGVNGFTEDLELRKVPEKIDCIAQDNIETSNDCEIINLMYIRKLKKK